LEVVHLFYAPDFIYNFTTLKELYINYNQFVIFDSYEQIEKNICNIPNMEVFVIKDNFKKDILDFEDFCHIVKTTYSREEVLDLIDDNLDNFSSFHHDERSGMSAYDEYPYCVYCEEYRTKFQTTDVIKILSDFFEINRYICEIWKNKKIKILPFISKNIKKVKIYFTIYDEDNNNCLIIKKNVADICNYNDDLLNIVSGKKGWVDLNDLETLPDTIKELHMNKLKKPITNFPTSLKKIVLLQK
jgi:hypothetical protein